MERAVVAKRFTGLSGRRKGVGFLFFLMAAILLLLFFADISTGTSALGFREITDIIAGRGNPDLIPLLLNFRLPRALTAIIAGVALSLSGLQMQTLFRNPLAGPYVLGISSGASLGVALLILGVSGIGIAGHPAIAGNWAIAVAAWLGSGLVLVVVMSVSFRVRDIMTVLILGIMLASAISAVVSILQYFSSESMLKAFVIWTMGSLGNLSWIQLQILIAGSGAGMVLTILSAKRLDALLTGEEFAKSMGVNITVSRALIMLSTTLMAGSVTAFCGPIAFIGIAVPHIARLVLGSTLHRYLIPGSALIGAIVMLAGDMISQVPGSDTLLPINSVTSLIGIPVIVWIIIRKNRLISVG